MKQPIATLHSLLLLALLQALLGAAFCSSVNAQKKAKRSPAPAARKIITDDAGLQQWAPWDKPPCPMCRTNKTIECPTCKKLEFSTKCLECSKPKDKKHERTKRATCHLCAGVGTLPDPLEYGPCPGCNGASVFPCFGCGGESTYAVKGNKKRKKCDVCKNQGSIPCLVCKGQRLVPSLKIKPSIGRATLKKLLAAQKILHKTIEDLKGFSATGDKPRKEMKAYQKLLKKISKIAPAMKKASSMYGDLFKRISAKDVYIGNNETKGRIMQRFIRYNLYYLEHQKTLLGLAIQRAEHNQEVVKAAKKK